MAPPDLILTGAPVYTMDAVRSWQEAVAISDGAISAVGTRDEVCGLAGTGTRVLDVTGCMVLPGFQDAHSHPPEGGMAQLQCDLHDLSDRDAYLEAVRGYAEQHPEEEWIRGDGWAMPAFPGGTPHRRDLDAIVPERPVVLINRDGHGSWVNSRALELAGITNSTPDPGDGRIERDAEGPTGALHEGAMDLVTKVMPEVTQKEWEEGLRVAQRQLHSLGITAWQDARVEPISLSAYRALLDGGELTARVVLSLLWDRRDDEAQIEGLLERRKYGTQATMAANTIKIFQDGVAENFTAAMTEPYLDATGASTGNSGLSMVPAEDLKRFVSALDAVGFQVHFHAIGDRAVREALDAVEAATKTNGRRDARHHIAHIQVIHPDDIARFRQLGVVANGQPFWAYEDAQMRDLTIPFMAEHRVGWQYPFASLRNSGATMAFGSDWPVSTANPLQEMDVALTRTAPEEPSAAPFLPEQALDLPTCLAAFTIGAAYVNRLDSQTGSIETGKRGDICVLDRNLFDLQPGERLGEANVLLTLIDGKPVFADPGLAW
jgi:predicted amidohydrolase YtcJ